MVTQHNGHIRAPLAPAIEQARPPVFQLAAVADISPLPVGAAASVASSVYSQPGQEVTHPAPFVTPAPEKPSWMKALLLEPFSDDENCPGAPIPLGRGRHPDSKRPAGEGWRSRAQQESPTRHVSTNVHCPTLNPPRAPSHPHLRPLRSPPTPNRFGDGNGMLPPSQLRERVTDLEPAKMAVNYTWSMHAALKDFQDGLAAALDACELRIKSLVEDLKKLRIAVAVIRGEREKAANGTSEAVAQSNMDFVPQNVGTHVHDTKGHEIHHTQSDMLRKIEEAHREMQRLMQIPTMEQLKPALMRSFGELSHDFDSRFGHVQKMRRLHRGMAAQIKLLETEMAKLCANVGVRLGSRMEGFQFVVDTAVAIRRTQLAKQKEKKLAEEKAAEVKRAEEAKIAEKKTNDAKLAVRRQETLEATSSAVLESDGNNGNGDDDSDNAGDADDDFDVMAALEFLRARNATLTEHRSTAVAASSPRPAPAVRAARPQQPFLLLPTSVVLPALPVPTANSGQRTSVAATRRRHREQSRRSPPRALPVGVPGSIDIFADDTNAVREPPPPTSASPAHRAGEHPNLRGFQFPAPGVRADASSLPRVPGHNTSPADEGQLSHHVALIDHLQRSNETADLLMVLGRGLDAQERRRGRHRRGLIELPHILDGENNPTDCSSANVNDDTAAYAVSPESGSNILPTVVNGNCNNTAAYGTSPESSNNVVATVANSNSDDTAAPAANVIHDAPVRPHTPVNQNLDTTPERRKDEEQLYC